MERPLSQGLFELGKRQRGCSNLPSREHPPPIVSAHKTECIPTLLPSNKLHTSLERLERMTAILLDSGASCSVLSSEHIFLPHLQQEHKIRQINADGWALSSMGITETDVVLGDFQTTHTFVIVDSLSTLCHPGV